MPILREKLLAYKFEHVHVCSQVFIKEEQSKLDEKLNKLKINQFSNVFRVGTFFLDLDFQNNQVSRVMFYQKVRGSDTIKEQTYENIKQLLDPFPFQL